MTISVLIGTYGEDSWAELARERALLSVRNQTVTPHEVLVSHEPHGTLASVRNDLALRASGDSLLFVDGDDELSRGYVESMNAAGPGELLNPAVQFVTPGQPHKPARLFRPIDLSVGNFLVIGTTMSRAVFWQAGGFDPQWEAYEDWSLMRRMVRLGARIVPVPRATYIAHWNSVGRNNTVHDAPGLMARITADYEKWQAAL